MQDCTYVVITTVQLLLIYVKGDWKRAWRREDSQCVRVMDSGLVYFKKFFCCCASTHIHPKTVQEYLTVMAETFSTGVNSFQK